MFGTTLILSLASLALSVSASCMHGTSHHRREVSAEGTVAVSKFGYSGDKGPLQWAGLDPGNDACRTSKVQSPIVLDNTVSKAKTAPKVTIPNVEEAEFENLGTTLETIVKGTAVVDGKTFQLKQFHIHTPSEHRINDEYFPLEMHMVHESADGGIAVIAIPFQLTEDGSTTELLTSVIKNIGSVAKPGSITKTGPLDFAPLIKAIETKSLFQYTGSLTTPPCAEGLTFLVMEEPMPVNVKTFNALKKVIKFNARYSQNPLGQTNLLDIAVDIAAKSPSSSLALARNASVAATTAGSSATTLDAASLAALFAGLGNSSDITVHTVTTTETKLLRGGKEVVLSAGAAKEAGVGKEAAPKEASKETASKETASKEAPKEKPATASKDAPVPAASSAEKSGASAVVVKDGTIPKTAKRSNSSNRGQVKRMTMTRRVARVSRM